MVVRIFSRSFLWKPLLALPKLSNTKSRVTKTAALAIASKRAAPDKPISDRLMAAPSEPRTSKPFPAKPVVGKSPLNPKESGTRPIGCWDHMNVAYLSCPYFDPDPLIKESRHIIVNRVAFELISQGTMVYSPLTHNLPIDRLGIHGNWVTWKDFDHTMLSRCNRLIVLKLKGWENSKGVAAEIACAHKLEIPIEWMEVHEDKYNRALAIAASPYKDILDRLQALNSEREWDQFHSPKNLAMSLTTEVGELVEHFRWMTESQSFVPSQQKLSEIRDEIGDVFLNLLHLAHTLGIELNQAAHDKLSEISNKYPIEQSKGLSDKYTDFKRLQKHSEDPFQKQDQGHCQTKGDAE